MITATGPTGPAESALVPGELVTYSRLFAHAEWGARHFPMNVIAGYPACRVRPPLGGWWHARK
jgi:hypothetical protein